ncbi:MAG: hypothetical protein U1A78_30625 [Polyangia bacterium]
MSSSAISALEGAAVDVAELHGEARQAFVRGLLRARRGHPQLVVLLGEAGAGKSHLLWWLKQQHQPGDPLEVCVPLPALSDLAQPFRHALRHLVAALCRRDESTPGTPPLERPIDVLLWQTLFTQASDLLDAARIGTYQGPAALMKTLGPLCLDAGRPRPLAVFAEEAQKVWSQVEPGLRSYLLSLPTEMSIDSTARAVVVQYPYADRRALVTAWLAGEDLQAKDRERLGAKQVINNESAAKYVLTSLVRLMAAAGAPLTLLFDQAEQIVEELKQPGLQALAEVISAVQQSGAGALQVLSCRPSTWQKLQDKPARPGPAQLKQIDHLVRLLRPTPELLRDMVQARLHAAFGDELPRPGPLYPLVEGDLSFLHEVDTPRIALEKLAQRFEERRAEATGQPVAASKPRSKDAPSQIGTTPSGPKATGKDGPSQSQRSAAKAEPSLLKSGSGRLVVPLQPFLNDSSPTQEALIEDLPGSRSKPALGGKPIATRKDGGDNPTMSLTDEALQAAIESADPAAAARTSGSRPAPVAPAASKPNAAAKPAPAKPSVVAIKPVAAAELKPVAAKRPEDNDNPTLSMTDEALQAAISSADLEPARTSGSRPAAVAPAASKPNAAKPAASKPSAVAIKPAAATDLKPVAAKRPGEGSENDNPTMSMSSEALQLALGADMGAAVAAAGLKAAAPAKAKPSVVTVKPSVAAGLKPVTAKRPDENDNPTMSMTDDALQRALGADLGAAAAAAGLKAAAPAKAKPSVVTVKPSVATGLKPVTAKRPEDNDNPTLSMTDDALQRALGADLGAAMSAVAPSASASASASGPASAGASKPVAVSKPAAATKPAASKPAAAKPEPSKPARPEQDNPTMAMSQEMLLAALQSAEAGISGDNNRPIFDSSPGVKQAGADRSKPSVVRENKDTPVRAKPAAAKSSQSAVPGTLGRATPAPVSTKDSQPLRVAVKGPIPATGIVAPVNVPEPLPESAATPSQGWLAMADDPLAQAAAQAKADLNLNLSLGGKAAAGSAKRKAASEPAAVAGAFKPLPATSGRPPENNAPEPLPESASTPSQGWLAMAGGEDPLAQALAQAKADLNLGSGKPAAKARPVQDQGVVVVGPGGRQGDRAESTKSGRSTQAKLPALQLGGAQSTSPQQILGRIGSRDRIEDWQLAEELGVSVEALAPVLERMEDEGQIRVMPRGDTRIIVRV